MKAEKNLMIGIAGGRGDVGMPMPALVGPLLGLAYIIVLPFVGVATFVAAGSYRAKQGLTTMWHRATQATVEAQEEARTGAGDLRDFLQPLINRLDCEFVVIDREFHITQYYTPPSRQNKMLEQTAIGQYCFEVSHGRNSPCESCECECPLNKVLQTNEAVTVTHYHKSQLEAEGKQRFVRILASPIRDSQGNITQVAELIWDASKVN